MKNILIAAFVIVFCVMNSDAKESSILSNYLKINYSETNEDSINIYRELADLAKKNARDNDRKISEFKKRIRTVKKEAQRVITELQCPRLDITAKEIEHLKLKMDEYLAKIEELESSFPSQIPSIENYRLEAFYRGKLLTFIEIDSIKSIDVYKLGLAQYKSKQYRKAALTFEKAVELKPDYLPSSQYWIQCYYYIENRNCDDCNEWLALKPSKKIIETWGNKPVNELSKKERDLLLIAYEVMIFYSFNPTGEEGNYHCDDAKPWVERIYEIDLDYRRIKSVVGYCN